MAKEGSVQDKIIAWLQSRGATYFKTHGSGVRSGEPDLVASLPPWGFTLVVEVKKPGGILSAQQRVRLVQWRRSGAIALAADSVEEVEATYNEQLTVKLATVKSLDTNNQG